MGAGEEVPQSEQGHSGSGKRTMARWRNTRLLQEATKLTPKEEKALAEESLAVENEAWR